MEYTFPFNTCETKSEIIAQPYSALVNTINCLIIFYFLVLSKSVFIFALFCFQVFHTFSHIVHINGPLQTYIAHFLSYLVNITLFFLLYKSNTSILYILFLCIIIAFDIYSLFHLPLIFYFFTQALIFVSIILYYFAYLPKYIQSSVYQIIVLVIIISLLVLNEKYNCDTMLDLYDFPYHILIEICGVILFYIVCKNFYKL